MCIRSTSFSSVASVSKFLPYPEASQVCCPVYLWAVRRQTSCCFYYQLAVSRGVLFKCKNEQRRRGSRHFDGMGVRLSYVKFSRRGRLRRHAAHSCLVVACELLAHVRAMTLVAQCREGRFGAPEPTNVKIDIASTGPVVRAVFGVFEEASRQTSQPV